MSAATCSTCGKQDHVYLEIANDLQVGMLARELYFCETCGAWLAGIIYAAMQRLQSVAVRDPDRGDPSR